MRCQHAPDKVSSDATPVTSAIGIVELAATRGTTLRPNADVAANTWVKLLSSTAFLATGRVLGRPLAAPSQPELRPRRQPWPAVHRSQQRRHRSREGGHRANLRGSSHCSERRGDDSTVEGLLITSAHRSTSSRAEHFFLLFLLIFFSFFFSSVNQQIHSTATKLTTDKEEIIFVFCMGDNLNLSFERKQKISHVERPPSSPWTLPTLLPFFMRMMRIYLSRRES